MNSRARCGLRSGLVAALVACLPLMAQSPARQEPAIRVTTRMVQVSVVVQDARGEPVTHLGRDDFIVLDEGRPEEIRYFSVEKLESVAATGEPLPAGTYSNRVERRGNTPRNLTVILLDGLNTRIEDQAYARSQVVKFLEQLQPEDRVAIYTLGSQLRILHDFSQDAGSLLRALARYRSGTAGELTTPDTPRISTGEADLDEWFREADQRERNWYAVNRGRRTIQALDAIARHLAPLPGHKSLIWVSASFPISIGLEELRSRVYTATTQQSFGPELERLARTLNHANLAIYPVDARGLVGPLSVATAEPDLDREAAYAGRSRRNPEGSTLAPLVSTVETMRLLADATGGRAFTNTNDIRGAIRRAIDESSVVYVIGFQPSHNRWNGRFRRLRVQVKDASLRLRHRTGYYALAPETLAPRQRQELLVEAAQFPLDAGELGLSVRLQRDGAVLKLEQSVEPGGIVFSQEGERRVASLDFLFVQSAPDGSTLSTQQQTLPLNLTVEQHTILTEEGLTVTKSLPAAAGAARLRVVVRDAASGALGSLTIPLAPAP